MDAKDKFEHLMIHLPEDTETLKKLIKLFAQESASLDTPAIHTAHKLFVKNRELSPKKKERQIRTSLADNSLQMFLALSEKTLKQFKNDFSKVFVDYPGVRSFADMVYKELKFIGYEKFTFIELMKLIEKRQKIIIPSKEKLRPFVYSLLKDAQYSKKMAFNHKKKKPEVVFFLQVPGLQLEVDALV